MILITQDFVLGIIIPLLSIYIRLCLEKWEVIKIWSESKYNVLNNLAFCALCYYTWSNIICSCLYSFYIDDYFFILYAPVFTVVSLIVHFKYFES